MLLFKQSKHWVDSSQTEGKSWSAERSIHLITSFWIKMSILIFLCMPDYFTLEDIFWGYITKLLLFALGGL